MLGFKIQTPFKGLYQSKTFSHNLTQKERL